MSVSTTEEKKCRVIQVMKDKEISTNYIILLFDITPEAAAEGFPNFNFS